MLRRVMLKSFMLRDIVSVILRSSPFLLALVFHDTRIDKMETARDMRPRKRK
jgi:hypothetical protein